VNSYLNKKILMTKKFIRLGSKAKHIQDIREMIVRRAIR
jgi:hypothetical protein